MSRLLLLLAFMVSSTSLYGVEVVEPDGRSDQNGAQQTQDTDEIAEQIAQLRRDLIQPGPEAQQKRRIALDSLLLMPDVRAHQAVCEVYEMPVEELPEGTHTAILSTLEAKWLVSLDSVFGEANKKRGELHVLYAGSLLKVFENEDPIAATGNVLARQRAVWACFRALSPLDRKNLFEWLVKNSGVERRRTAIWGIAGCRDLGLGPLIARSLEDRGALGAAARAALSMLTFVERPFRSKEEFDAWYASNTMLYVDLAERAARERTLSTSAHIQRLESELIGALASSAEVDWNRIAALLAGSPSPEATRLYLRRLNDVLAGRRALGGTTEARRDLLAQLEKGLGSGIDTVEYGLRLEVLAQLVVEGDPQSETVLGKLVDGTRHADSAVRLSALRGLSSHYSVMHRSVVVEAGRAARAAKQDALLSEALNCLAQRDWVAPSHGTPAITPWLDLLRQVLSNADYLVPFQSQAIEVLVQQTAEKTRLPEAFRLLRDAAGPDRNLVPLVRKQALARLRLFADDPARADEYVKFVAGLLPDEAPAVREAAARMLRELPEGNRKQRESWTAIVVKDVGARLAIESNEAALRAAFDCLMSLSGGADDSTNVIGKFAAAVEAYLARPPAEQKPFQRELLVDGLGQLGGVQGRGLAQWIRVADSLARLEDRQALRFVLDRQHVANLAGRDGDEYVAVWKLVLAAGKMAPPDTDWSARKAEAEEIRVAFDELERLQQPPTEPTLIALRVLVLGGLDRHAGVVKYGVQALSDKTRPLPPELKRPVVLAVARSYMATAEFAKARELLQPLEDGPVVLGMFVALAESHLQRNEFELAESAMARVMSGTRPTDPEFALRFLIASEARYRRSPKENAAVTAEALREQQELFDDEATPVAVKQRFAALLTEIANGEG